MVTGQKQNLNQLEPNEFIGCMFVLHAGQEHKLWSRAGPFSTLSFSTYWLALGPLQVTGFSGPHRPHL